MIVLDASALLELILATPTGHRIADRIADPSESLNTPHLADIEVLQALRRYLRRGAIDLPTASMALADLRGLDITRHAHEPLLERAWELRDNLTAYDAAYAALTEILDATLLTCDGPLSRVPALAGRAVLVQGFTS